MLKGRLITVSYDDKSFAHKKLSPLKAIFDGKNLNKAKNTGICNNAGIHPESMLTPAFR